MSKRDQVRAIWDAGVFAANPQRLVHEFVAGNLAPALAQARRIVVVGGGKAGAAMAQGFEAGAASHLRRVEGLLNVPEGSAPRLNRIRLHTARPAGSNHPTPEGVAGSEEMLRLLAQCQADDLGICLLSGGGSALLPAPVESITLADKQNVTRVLHRCGASIHEMNTVRKHLSRLKGGGFVRAFQGRRLVSLIISDVVGDPLDVIASGPTAADPTTFADALAILHRHNVWKETPQAIRGYLEAGQRGEHPETLKLIPPQVENQVLGSNLQSLRACQSRAEALGYRVVNLGAFIEGETKQIAVATAGIVRSIRRDGLPLAPPACLLIGGETTVTLPANPGRGGRNLEFVLAMIDKLGIEGMQGVTILSGGTDGEDGPTDSAGAWADLDTLRAAQSMNADLAEALERHASYEFFDRVGGLIKTGLTGTNVADLRVVLIE